MISSTRSSVSPANSDSIARPTITSNGADPHGSAAKLANLHAAWLCRAVAAWEIAQHGTSAATPAAAS